MPAFIAPLVGTGIGVGFAAAASDTLARGQGSGATSRVLIVVAVFSLLIFAPLCGYFLAFSPDWSYAYLIDSKRLPSALDLSLVLVDAASIPLGFAIAARRARLRQVNAALQLLGPLCVLCVLALIILFPRLSVLGTYAQFHGDFGTRSVFHSSLGYAMVWLNGVLIGSVIWTARKLRRLGA